VNDCSTQRNLSNEGRQQASKIGEKIRKHGIKTASVFSSAWCRCRETAKLLNIGKVSTLQPLNSFFVTLHSGNLRPTLSKIGLLSIRGNQPKARESHERFTE
jgi:phosphohistidine phosphatase SixA